MVRPRFFEGRDLLASFTRVDGGHVQAKTAAAPPGLEERTTGEAREVDSSDLELVARARDGDAAAWRRLYDRQFDYVFRIARRLGTPDEEAEDVAQEVFEVMLARLDQFRFGRLTTWTFRITSNVVSEHHRRRRVRRAFEKLGVVAPARSAPPTPERLAESKSASVAVQRILERMSPKKREVFVLFELEGLSGAEVADQVGCPEGTVWTRLHHARKDFVRLGRKLGSIDPEGTS